MEEIRALIGRRVWVFAKTYAETLPHEYTTRKKGGTEEDFFALFDAIQAHGVDERYAGRKKKYLYPGDGWKYFTMTTSKFREHVINRQKIENDYARLRSEGQPTRDKDGKIIDPPEQL